MERRAIGEEAVVRIIDGNRQGERSADLDLKSGGKELYSGRKKGFDVDRMAILRVSSVNSSDFGVVVRTRMENRGNDAVRRNGDHGGIAGDPIIFSRASGGCERKNVASVSIVRKREGRGMSDVNGQSKVQFFGQSEGAQGDHDMSGAGCYNGTFKMIGSGGRGK